MKRTIRDRESVMFQPGLEVVDLKTPEPAEREERELPSLISKALKAFEDRLQNEDFRPSLAEYLKLLQIEQELNKKDEKPQEIKVTWVEPGSISFEE